MSKKDWFIVILKSLVYFLGLVLTSFGVVALSSSCSVSKDTTIAGKATIISTDTTYIFHNTLINFPKHK